MIFDISRALTFMLFLTPSTGFGIYQPITQVNSALNGQLQDNLQKIIDNAVDYSEHKEERNAKSKADNDQWLDQKWPEGFEFNSISDVRDDSAELLRKDVWLAKTNPQKYCADRCVELGYCDVFEDVFKLEPWEVKAFCKDCVLSDGEEPCDVPEGALEEGFEKLNHSVGTRML